MIINAVNLYRNIGVQNSTGFKDAGVIPKGDTKPNELSVKEANGGVSRDGDTFTVSAEGSLLQKMGNAKADEKGTDRLAEDRDDGNPVASAVSFAARQMGITKEANERQSELADVRMLDQNRNAAADSAKAYREDLEERRQEDTRKEDTAKADINVPQGDKEAGKNIVNAAGNEDKAVKEKSASLITDKAFANEKKEDIAADLKGVKQAEETREKDSVRSVQDKDRKDDHQEALREKRQQEEIRQENLQSRRQEAGKQKEDFLTERSDTRRSEIREERAYNQQKSGENLEKAIGNRGPEEDAYKVKLSFNEDPYDVAARNAEKETDEETVAGVNRVERQENERREASAINPAAPETAEDNEEMENIEANLNTEVVANADNSNEIAAAGAQTAAATVEQNQADSRFIVQDVA